MRSCHAFEATGCCRGDAGGSAGEAAPAGSHHAAPPQAARPQRAPWSQRRRGCPAGVREPAAPAAAASASAREADVRVVADRVREPPARDVVRAFIRETPGGARAADDRPGRGRRDTAAESDDPEDRILLELARESESRVAFNGLKRRLAIHPQVLTRTLRRLAEAGLVEGISDDAAGYRLTERGFARISGRGIPERGGAPIGLAHALLPPDVAPDEAAARLAGRWFGSLRWFGRSDAPGETTLTWLTPAGNAVRVRLTGGVLAVEADAADAEAFAAVRPLLAEAAELYARRPSGAAG